MAKSDQKKKGGGARKIGRDSEKCKRYTAGKHKERNALKHILESGGFEEAVAYAKAHGLQVPIERKRKPNPNTDR
jgi:hypothetical protein